MFLKRLLENATVSFKFYYIWSFEPVNCSVIVATILLLYVSSLTCQAPHCTVDCR